MIYIGEIEFKSMDESFFLSCMNELEDLL